MSDEKSKRQQAREDLNEAIGNGQIHPAIGNFLAVLDDDVQGHSDRHDALVRDLNDERDERARLAEDRQARDDDATDDGKTVNEPAVKPTPATAAKPTPGTKGSVR